MIDIVTQIQMLFPRIYMACHIDHKNRRSSDDQISDRDAAILAHLEQPHYKSAKNLALHLNIAPSTMSEALHHLVSLGCVRFKPDETDARHTVFSLTEKGIDAIKKNSVLDAKKVADLLENLSDKDQQKAVEGLKILANAALL